MKVDNAPVIAMLAGIIEKLASGEMESLTAETYVESHTVRFYPLGEAPYLRKAGPNTTTLTLKMMHKEPK